LCNKVLTIPKNTAGVPRGASGADTLDAIQVQIRIDVRGSPDVPLCDPDVRGKMDQRRVQGDTW
jgi:hypothetical protein